MKKLILIVLASFLSLALAMQSGYAARDEKTKIILLIAEQNIESPQFAWWLSEVDLSTTELKVAQQLIAQGYEVLEPSNLTKILRQDKAFRLLNLADTKSVKLGNLAKADYVVLGKAVASAGGNIVQSRMRSCFANVTAKLIRVKDGKVIAYLDAAGNSAHMDVITGGREALSSAGGDLAEKIINALTKDGGKQ
ncbi:MAG: CsgG/HfaB family protein [Candidatus Omnitrophota bacterium]|nr:CsgG/HfaB family protein [Candidatus Omnitrophota bacterium]